MRHDDYAMVSLITKWEFTGSIANWITEILVKNSRLPFSEAKIEERSPGSRKRRDLTLLYNEFVL